MLPFASFAVTVTLAAVPAVTEPGVPERVSVAAAPGTVVIALVVPLCVPSSPVTVCAVPATVEVVKLTVAMPEPLVVEVRRAERAAGAGLRPVDGEAARGDGVAVGVGELRGDRDRVAGDRAVRARRDQVLGRRPAGTVVIVLEVPLCVPSSPVTVWVVPAVVEVVKLTVAMPEPLVVEVAEPKMPPAPVFDQLTVRPLVETALLLASASWAVIVTALPATGP